MIIKIIGSGLLIIIKLKTTIETSLFIKAGIIMETQTVIPIKKAKAKVIVNGHHPTNGRTTTTRT